MEANMNTKLKTIVAAIGMGLALTAGQALAFTDAATFLPSNSPIQFKYNNLEVVVSQEGDTGSGIFTISSLGDPSGTPIYWASGLSGSELNGSFSNLTVAQIVGVPGGQNIYFTGGTLTIYNVANGSYNPSAPPTTDAQICGGACPTPWLTMDFVPGIVLVDDGATAFDETLTTLFSTVSGLTSPFTGTGDGNLVVTGGTAAGYFNPDFSLQSNLQTCPTTDPNFAPNCAKAGSWPLASFDPMIGSTVPEPGTLFLLGAGLLGAGFANRRRKAA
jgi:hypothetical protein